jgi:ketosteroid isomerase-like protein
MTRLLLVLVLVGCGEKDAAKKEENRRQETGEAKQESGAGQDRQPGLQPAEVTALVERWKAAQNQRDFAAYQPLYAVRMTGIKRVGPRVFTFDREGWMKDRGRMFRKKMEVAVDEVDVKVAGPSAVVRFEQTFKQGRFQDTGRKQLVVVREGGELRIAREEMLSSTVIGAKAAGGGAASDTFLMLDGEVLLAQDTALDVEGAPTLDAGEGSASFRARAEVDRGRLDDRTRRLVGETFTVYGERGATCQATLDRVGLVSGMTPHFGTVAEWHGQAETPALDSGEIAALIWESGRTVLVGRPGQCNGLIARAGGPPVVAFEDVDDHQLATVVLASFRKLDEWAKTQREFAATGQRGSWDHEGTIVRLFRHPTSGAMWAVVHATGGELCSPFSAEMTAVFERTGSTWKDVSAATLEPFEAAAAFDLDGDGKPEFVAPRLLVGDIGDGFGTLLEFAYPDHDCPC